MHRQIVKHWDSVQEWFKQQQEGLPFPLYTSFDLRDSGRVVAPVDANVFPAGFNNICQTDKENAVGLVGQYLDKHYPDISKNIVLVTEEHTKNSYYWENVYTLVQLIKDSGRNIQITFPKTIDEKFEVESATGQKLTVSRSGREGSDLVLDCCTASLILSNNDFSDKKGDWIEGLATPMNPPYEMGWHVRKKEDFFKEYNSLATEFARLIDVNEDFLTVETESFSDFDINSEESREALASRVDLFLDRLRKRNPESAPFAFIKNSSGTYGLGVTQVKDGDEIRSWNSKSRKKMKATKGGGKISNVIIQEGISSEVQFDGATAEPAIYMVGSRLAGGFLRTHEKKGATESLNSPGAVFKRLCTSDLDISVEGHPLENVYGWVARLGALAVAREAQARNVVFKGYQL